MYTHMSIGAKNLLGYIYFQSHHCGQFEGDKLKAKL